MESTVRSSRRALAAIGVAALGAVSCFVGVAEAQMEHGHSGGAAGILPPGDWTEAQVELATDLVQRTEEALPEFLTREDLAARGYEDFSTPATPWDHWTNSAYKTDGRFLDPTAPETLVLRTTPEGYRVMSAMFQMPPGSTMADIPEEVAWLPGWHEHMDICFDGNRFAGFATNGVCGTGTLLITTPMLHVWTSDTSCGHRFPGVGAGLMCGSHGPGGHGGTIPPGSGPRGTGPGTVIIEPVRSTTTRPSTTTTTPPVSPPATPVTAEPHYTG